ncbi:Aquaporin [Arachis hypogaea]|nr:Aquaporin [Arachis hypogaea]
MFGLTCSIIIVESKKVAPVVLVPFAVFIISFWLLIVTVPLSGRHLSPTITLISLLKIVITITRALMYAIAQCIGSIIGFIMIKYIMDPKLQKTYSLGGCVIGDDHHKGLGSKPLLALLIEFFCTFIVLLVGVTLSFDRIRSNKLGLRNGCMLTAGSVAFVVFVSTNITGHSGYAGVGLNPARCLGPALLRGGSLWNEHWIFWVGPFLACIVYGLLIHLPSNSARSEDSSIDVANDEV